jgi:signal transduction histidine kinase
MCRRNKRDKWSRRWERWEVHHDDSFHPGSDKWDKWSRQWQEWERWADNARRHVDDFKNGAAATTKSEKTRGEVERFRSGAPDTKPLNSGAQSEQSARDAERAAYERARRRAAREAGFYAHLLWYGLVIGSCLILNELVSPGFQWWIFAAIGWGIGLASHFGAVYGWRWIHERIFEPVIKREVQREVKLEKEAMQTEKQASLDELTASFAHEIRNPIAAAKSLVQQMGEDPTSNENVEYARVALDELARVERSVSHLLKYAKEEEYHFDNVNLASVLDQALTQMRSKLEAAGVKISRSYIGGPTVRADADKLRQVFSNIIDNAIDAMRGGSERRLELGIVRLYPDCATVLIRDNGCGIPEDQLAKIFNPFFTTKQSGTGLGMGIARKVMDAHHGRIEVQSQAGIGTELRLTIPVSDAVRASDANSGAHADNHGSTPAGKTPDGNDSDDDYRGLFGSGSNAAEARR